MTDLNETLAAAIQEREALRTELGEAILAGSDTKALDKKLALACAKAEDIYRAVSAVESVKAKAVAAARAAEADEKERARKDAIDRAFKSAQEDHAELMRLAGDADTKFAAFVAAMISLEDHGREFVDKHAPLNLSRNATDVIMRQSWVSQVLLNLRNFGGRGFRNWFAATPRAANHLTGSGKMTPIASFIPSLPTLFGGRGAV